MFPAIETLIILCLAILVWIFFGYPAVLWLLTRRVMQQNAPSTIEPAESMPTVSLIIPTFNESVVLEKKIQNVRELAYPKDKLEVLLVDSQSTDGTADLARRLAPEFHVHVEAYRGGKARAINGALPNTRGQIIVITDANAFMKPDVLNKVVTHFRDPLIGAATGSMRQVDRSQTAVSEGGGYYWKLETFLRRHEAALHSVISMSGEISAFRRDLFVTPDNRVVDWYQPGGTDDFEMTLWTIRQGKRVAYAQDAFVWEYAPDTIADLFRQKVRIIVQTIISVRRNMRTLWSAGSYGWITFPSRKLLPLLAPFALLIIFFGTGFLGMSSPGWLWFFYVQVICYLLAVAGFWPLSRWSTARLALFFVLLHGTVFVAWLEYWRGKDYTHWNPIASSRRI